MTYNELIQRADTLFVQAKELYKNHPQAIQITTSKLRDRTPDRHYYLDPIRIYDEYILGLELDIFIEINEDGKELITKITFAYHKEQGNGDWLTREFNTQRSLLEDEVSLEIAGEFVTLTNAVNTRVEFYKEKEIEQIELLGQSLAEQRGYYQSEDNKESFVEIVSS